MASRLGIVPELVTWTRMLVRDVTQLKNSRPEGRPKLMARTPQVFIEQALAR